MLPKLTSEIKRAMLECGETRQSICRATGLDPAALSRFANGKLGLSVESIEKLADHLGLEIIVRPKRRKAETRGKHRKTS